MTTLNQRPDFIQKVQEWAKEHASEDYMYGAPYSYFAKALSCALINNTQYEQARQWYGRLWDYRGD